MDTLKYSVVIATYNRAADLRDTLESLAGLQPDGPWEVIVVDNNSTDDTRAGRRGRGRASFPRRCATCSNASRGAARRSNAGIRSRRATSSSRPTTTCRVEADWLDRAAEGLERLGCDYVGGRVLPIWGGTAAGVAAQSWRQALGGDRAARLRAGASSSSARAFRSA